VGPRSNRASPGRPNVTRAAAFLLSRSSFRPVSANGELSIAADTVKMNK
jgi:hypothetical protein